MADSPVARGRASRRERLRELIERRGIGAVLLRRPANFAWYTGGADSKVDHVSPLGVADVVLTPERELVLTSTIEAPRMRLEQTPDLEVLEYPWHEGPEAALREATGGASLGADVELDGAADLAADVAALRRVLDPDAVERLRAVGRDASAAMAEAAGAVEPAMDEHEAAAALAAACKRRGLTPTVLLAAADERIRLHRHPLPAGARIERRAMLVASAERGGLYANLTRMVELEEPGPELARRLDATGEILRRMREEATRSGRTLADAFADCTRFYAEAGYPDEWRLHHQGGTTGYGSREVIAMPGTAEPIVAGNAFAWNPSITGAKAEETFILTEDGPEVVTSGSPPAVASDIPPAAGSAVTPAAVSET
jgi:Xaa-Pro dipeptidase